MRIALDPVPLVVGIYVYAGDILARAAQQREGESAETLARRHARAPGAARDREVRRLVHALHADVKTADKLLRKTADVWEISQETDLVNLVIQESRGQEPKPRAYVLLHPDQVRAVLHYIRDAARGAGESDETIQQLERAIDAIAGRPGDYLAFGFDRWEA